MGSRIHFEGEHQKLDMHKTNQDKEGTAPHAAVPDGNYCAVEGNTYSK